MAEDQTLEARVQGKEVKPKEASDIFQKGDKNNGFSRQIVEDHTCSKTDRVSYCEEDSSSLRVDRIKVPSSSEEDGSGQWPDNMKISQVDKDQTSDKVDMPCAKVSAREVVDERLIGEYPHQG